MDLFAGGNRTVDIEGGKIEMQRRVTGDAVVRTQSEVPDRPTHEMDHVGVRNHDPFWRARRAGREQDVSRVVIAAPGAGRLAAKSLDVVPEKWGFDTWQAGSAIHPKNSGENSGENPRGTWCFARSHELIYQARSGLLRQHASAFAQLNNPLNPRRRTGGVDGH